MVMKRNLFAAGTLSVYGASGYCHGERRRQMAEVIVTAQGREQRLQDVPVAVSVVSGADLERVNIKTLQDVTSRLGNVKITTGTLTNPINIRGIGSGNNSGFEQSVATFSDGVCKSAVALHQCRAARPGARGGAEGSADHVLRRQRHRRRVEHHHAQAGRRSSPPMPAPCTHSMMANTTSRAA
jgi:hypothetical protein